MRSVCEVGHEGGHEGGHEVGHEVRHEVGHEVGHDGGHEGGPEVGHEVGHEVLRSCGCAVLRSCGVAVLRSCNIQMPQKVPMRYLQYSQGVTVMSLVVLLVSGLQNMSLNTNDICASPFASKSKQ